MGNSIDLRRFVDINIQQHVLTSVSGTRDTVILYTSEGNSPNTRLIPTMRDANVYYPKTSFPTTNAYLSVFFNNGGAKVLVIEGTPVASVTADIISALDNKYIVIVCASTLETTEATYTAMKNIAISRNSIYGISEKILVGRTNVIGDAEVAKNFAVKYSGMVGGEMTIAAYLSKLNVYGTDTVFDYAFTQEVIDEETLTDSQYGSIIENNMNVAVYLANGIRNCGGNLKDGTDLINSYVRIILHQTTTDRLIQLLSQKIKNSNGIGKIYSVIAQELENYRTNGYLTTDKIWTDSDFTIVYNGQQYTIIEQGTALSTGYIIRVLPLLALTDSDKVARKAPPIYVILADQYGIRTITINGEII